LIINKPFKYAMIDDWLRKYDISGKNKTKNGYLRPPSYIIICGWVRKTWNNISSDLVKKLFYCGGIVLVKLV